MMTRDAAHSHGRDTSLLTQRIHKRRTFLSKVSGYNPEPKSKDVFPFMYHARLPDGTLIRP